MGARPLASSLLPKVNIYKHLPSRGIEALPCVPARSFGHLAFCMGEGTECRLAGQPGRLQLDLTTFKLPWGSSTGNAAGEVEFLARGAAADPAPTRRSLIE